MTTECADLTPELVQYYRQVLVTHGNVSARGTCAVCGVPRCPDWTYAYDALAAARQLMGEPAQWQPPSRGQYW